MKANGAVAAGHHETADAATQLLKEGGNAFDAALCALCVACVAEPVMASLGGGGFFLARRANGDVSVYDFFAQTPKARGPAAEVDFFPIIADFGTAQQEFHIGLGSAATPGVVKGLFDVHRELGSVPMTRIVGPAAALARDGVQVDRLRAYILEIVGRIYERSASSLALFGSQSEPGRLLGEGEIQRFPALADLLESLARDGEDLFYRGEIARRIAEDCRAAGGRLTIEDFADYRTVKRSPLDVTFADARILANPPPSVGGILMVFALELLKGLDLASLGFGTAAYVEQLAVAMALTNEARVESRLDESSAAETLLEPAFLARYRDQVAGHPVARRGTTHVSIIDGEGNAASLSVTNGEGCGYIVPDCGFMLNNMLGEEDLNAGGFHQWLPDTRMSSMMAPCMLALKDGAWVALGSGGSNRIRTALLQVILNLLAFTMSIDDAVTAPRIHVEGDRISVEGGFDGAVAAALGRISSDIEAWDERNLYFGGVHAVAHDPATGRFEGAGDDRRGGVAKFV